MKVCKLSIVTDECEKAANAFSINDIGLALMHTTKALMHSVNCNGNTGTLKELLLPSRCKIIGQSPNKMYAVAITLLYQANYHAEKGEINDAIETLFEICILNNVDLQMLTVSDFESEEAIAKAAKNIIKLSSKRIIEVIDNA